VCACVRVRERQRDRERACVRTCGIKGKRENDESEKLSESEGMDMEEN
jgi:hypothetical protein